ncbi:MAG: hypothetical protein AAF909_15360, partial [Pseudomonadota bacterium]
RPERFDAWRAEARALARRMADRLPWSAGGDASARAAPARATGAKETGMGERDGDGEDGAT